jgi:hypothetical protein
MMFQSKKARSIVRSLDRFFMRKTVRGFAGQVATLEDLALPVQMALRPHLTDGDPVAMILTVPAQSVLVEQEKKGWWPRGLLPWTITPHRVLVLTSSRLLVASRIYVEETGEVNRDVNGEYLSEWTGVTELPEVAITPLEDILFLESGTILLFSWLDWAWVRDGRLEHTRVYFNTVNRSLFETLAGLVRRSILASNGVTLSSEDQGLDQLEEMPFKFKSLIPKHLLLPGEQVQAALFRPSLWTKDLSIFRRHVAPKLAAIRTNGALILAQEDLTSEEDSYGLIAQFCLRPYVRRIALEETPVGSDLVVHLSLGGVEQELRRPFPVHYWDERLGLQ